MPKPKRLPSYRSHKPSGQAVVDLNGHTHYLGIHGSECSKANYDRLIAEWLANGRRPPRSGDDHHELTVSEIVAAYWQWAQGYYVKNGKPTTELSILKLAFRYLRRLYGHTAVTEFGPIRLKACVQAIVEDNRSRCTVNAYLNRIKRLFKWAVEHEMAPPSIYHGLQAVVGLRKGRSAARETEPVKPVAVEHAEASKPFLSR